ncbi:hypothetical protein AnigIFM50267_004672 [Aspergillus niger]|nr:hypothetical protein AnigIFM50267_004672 [Aspergillus niger]
MPASESVTVVLVFGAGKNVGLSVTRKFSAEGWKVVTVSRNPSKELEGAADLTITADLTDPSSVDGIFDRVEREFGTPHVVVYNAYAMHMSDPQNVLSVSAADIQADLSVNTVSAYAAAFRLARSISNSNTLPSSDLAAAQTGATPAFIYTGNMMNTQLFPVGMSLGMGKNATAYFIETAAHTYQGLIRFYYADERNEKGKSVMSNISGETHAQFYWDLANRKEQGAWAPTFVRVDGKVQQKKMDEAVDREFYKR